MHAMHTQDAFVVRYDAAGQGGLATHTDDSELSFNLLLSDPSDFGGGGTSFEAAGETGVSSKYDVCKTVSRASLSSLH